MKPLWDRLAILVFSGSSSKLSSDLSASEPSGFAVLSGSCAASAPGCSFWKVSRRNLQRSTPFRTSRGLPSACSYSARISGGSFARSIPSLTKFSWTWSDSSPAKKVGVGPWIHVTPERRLTGNTAWFMAARHVDTARIVCKRSPRTGNKAKYRSSGNVPSETKDVQCVMRPRMLHATGPSKSILFQRLSNDGWSSSSSGNGKAFRDDSSAKLPCSHAQLPLLKGVGGPQQILPPRGSSSTGLTRTAAAPWGKRATPCGWSNCSCTTFNMASSVTPTL
mmetsp:Transcript_3902/g.11755  ORF Transcript_3902/g.11755 Transcript_3902/m.11755 type:complete len:278 (+) Transcript_3902:3421-4254(+)